MADEKEKIDWVTVELSRKMVNTKPEFLQTFTNKEGVKKTYTSIMGPYNSSFLYPISGLKQYKDNPDRITFTRPAGTDIYLSIKNGDEFVKKIVKIEELVQMYAQSRDEYIAEQEAQSDFYNLSVPTSWGKAFTGKDGKEYVSIGVQLPVHDASGNTVKNEKGYDETAYYNFIVAKDNFKKSSRSEGMSYFGLFKHAKDSDEAYQVKLTRSVSDGNGGYVNETIQMSSEELKTHVEEAVAKSNYLNNLTSISVSEKMVSERSYTDKKTGEEKKFFSVAIPVMENEQTVYFRASLAPYMVHVTEDKAYLNLPINNKDGQPFIFKATVTAKNDAGEYVPVAEREFTSNQIVEAYKESHKRYVAENNNEMPFTPDVPSAPSESQAQNVEPMNIPDNYEDLPEMFNDESAAQDPIAPTVHRHGR